MRCSAILLALAIAAPAASAGRNSVPAPAAAADRPVLSQVPAARSDARECPQTTTQYAGKGSSYRGGPLAPQKLTELPSATGYMAVYRTVNGCEIPLTIVEYRGGQRR